MDAYVYAGVIVLSLAIPNYDGFADLVETYQRLPGEEKRLMHDGLVLVIARHGTSPGIAADAIHLAYHLKLFSDPMISAVASYLMTDDPRVEREFDNYCTYLEV